MGIFLFRSYALCVALNSALSHFCIILTQQTGGEYVWTDGWPDIYRNWGDDEPVEGEGCVAMEEGGMWSDTECDRNHTFVCKQSTGQLDAKKHAFVTMLCDLFTCYLICSVKDCENMELHYFAHI